jgi:hypothetical protein
MRQQARSVAKLGGPLVLAGIGGCRPLVSTGCLTYSVQVRVPHLASGVINDGSG